MVQSTHHRLSFIKCFSINKLLIFVLYLRLHHRSCRFQSPQCVHVYTLAGHCGLAASLFVSQSRQRAVEEMLGRVVVGYLVGS